MSTNYYFASEILFIKLLIFWYNSIRSYSGLLFSVLFSTVSYLIIIFFVSIGLLIYYDILLSIIKQGIKHTSI